MALPREYTAESCPIARSLEIIGERWTLLIVRDAFYGVRRFSDFHAHLGIPKAVLADRLALLVAEGVLTKTSAASGHDEYVLTEKGRTAVADHLVADHLGQRELPADADPTHVSTRRLRRNDPPGRCLLRVATTTRGGGPRRRIHRAGPVTG